MWIDKAEPSYSGKRYLFEEFLDAHGYNSVEIVGEKQINNTQVYVVKANYYVKDLIKQFYFNDFSVMTDIMENESYVLKDRNINIDLHWGLYIKSRLNKEESKAYVKEFKDYHKKELEREKEELKYF